MEGFAYSGKHRKCEPVSYPNIASMLGLQPYRDKTSNAIAVSSPSTSEEPVQAGEPKSGSHACSTMSTRWLHTGSRLDGDQASAKFHNPHAISKMSIGPIYGAPPSSGWTMPRRRSEE